MGPQDGLSREFGWQVQCHGLYKSCHPPKPKHILKSDSIAKAIEDELAHIQDSADGIEEDRDKDKVESDWESVLYDKDDKVSSIFKIFGAFKSTYFNTSNGKASEWSPAVV